MTNADDEHPVDHWPRLCPIDAKPINDEHPGRQSVYCSAACRMVAYRRRRNVPTPVSVPAGQPRRPVTVYECEGCGSRALGEQRCDECGTFMRRIGFGGSCPHCDEPVALVELGWSEA